MHLPYEVFRRGGLAATWELLRAGATQKQLSWAVATGLLVRVRQGWYALPQTDAELAQAVRVGGRLGCVSGARFHGLWVSQSPDLHVRVSAHSSRLRDRRDKAVRLSQVADSGVRVHWRPHPVVGTRFVVSPRDCLWDMAWCQSPERVVAAVDSALRAGSISRARWLKDIERMPRRLHTLLSRVDRRSESITESIVRFRLEVLGYFPQLQVQIDGVGRVDMMLGDRLVIELDGWEFHKSREDFERDRRRDAQLAALGYRVLRFSYRQVTRRWHEVLGAIEACLDGRSV
jgi:very-short-patch-repair endonuclease